MTRRWLVNGVLLAVLWIFVRGVPASPPVRLVEEGIIGLLVGLPTAWGLRRFYGDSVTSRTARMVPYALLYLGAFLKELLVANVAVARIVLSPSLDIRPAVVEVPLRVESDAAVTTIANSITLTPGTLTMDYDADRNALYVHSIDVDDPEEVIAPIRVWEDYALAIFDEELKPGDPVPDRVADGGRTESGTDRRDTPTGTDDRPRTDATGDSSDPGVTDEPTGAEPTDSEEETDG